MIPGPLNCIDTGPHAGVFLGNTKPEKFHIHTLVRTPNGNGNGYGNGYGNGPGDQCGTAGREQARYPAK